jgi:hypothetical protein
VALVLATAVTFGFALLIWFFALATLIAVFFLVRDGWRRWRFLHNARPKPPTVIEGEYEDITHDKEGPSPPHGGVR